MEDMDIMVPLHDQGKDVSSASADSSVTEWIAGLKAGEAEAADRLWNRYFQGLCGWHGGSWAPHRDAWPIKRTSRQSCFAIFRNAPSRAASPHCA